MDINSKEAKRMLAYHRENEKLKEEKQELLEALNKIQKQCKITPEGANCTVLNKTIDIVVDATKDVLQEHEEGENE